MRENVSFMAWGNFQRSREVMNMENTQQEMAIRKILTNSKTIAVVGISADLKRASNYVAKYLQKKGHIIIPVNPNLQFWEGIECYPELRSIPKSIQIDVVVVFRKPEFCAEIALAAVEMNAGVLWLQEGIRSADAEKIAGAARMPIIQDRCMMKEHRRLFGD
ncbi:MAG: CoA-binding protein [Candidatus Micrarchaeota archaeon]